MNKSEKLQYLQDNHFGEWMQVRQEVEDEMSAKQTMFCVCRKLATGMHESSCKKFRNKVTDETVSRLENLIKKPA